MLDAPNVFGLTVYEVSFDTIVNPVTMFADSYKSWLVKAPMRALLEAQKCIIQLYIEFNPSQRNSRPA